MRERRPAPVASVSLGDEALFRIGGPTRGGATESVWLKSGDIVVLQGESRLAFHGIDRVRAGSSTLLPQGGRFNLTLRVAGCAVVAMPFVKYPGECSPENGQLSAIRSAEWTTAQRPPRLTCRKAGRVP